jgi:hypothetical protein
LNQNKNALVAEGLDSTGYGVDMSFTTFKDGQPMVPTALALPAWDQLPKRLYGVDNSSADFPTEVPSHPTGNFFPLKNYWCTGAQSTSTGGWPNIMEHVETMNADASSGSPVADYNYHPKFAPLKLTVPWRDTGAPRHVTNSAGSANIPEGIGWNQPVIRSAGLYDTVGATYSTLGGAATQVDATEFGYEATIEKSAYAWKGIFPNEKNGAHQPSLHVGVLAVPSLTTAAITTSGNIDTYTDVECYFDVECEMTTRWTEHADRQFGTLPDFALGQQVFRTSQRPSTRMSTLQGRLPTYKALPIS